MDRKLIRMDTKINGMKIKRSKVPAALCIDLLRDQNTRLHYQREIRQGLVGCDSVVDGNSKQSMITSSRLGGEERTITNAQSDNNEKLNNNSNLC